MSNYTYTHTFAKLDVSAATIEEIRGKLTEAGYDDQIHVEDDGEVLIDMHGIALVKNHENNAPTKRRRISSGGGHQRRTRNAEKQTRSRLDKR